MSAFVSLSDLTRTDESLSPEAMRRRVELLQARIAAYVRQAQNLAANLNHRVPVDIPMTQRRVELLGQAIQRLRRKVAKLEHRIRLAGDRSTQQVETADEDLSGIFGPSTGASVFPPLPSSKGLSDIDERLVETRSLVVPEFVNAVQAPRESAFEHSVGFEAGGDVTAVDENTGAEMAFEGLTSGESVDGVAILDGLNQQDQTDAGGQQAFTNVQGSFSIDDGGVIDGGDLVEPGQGQQPQDLVEAPQEIQPVSQAEPVRQGNNRIAAAVMNRPRVQNGVVTAPVQRPQAMIRSPRLDAQRNALRRQMNGNGMGQLAPAQSTSSSAFDLVGKVIGTGADVASAALSAQGGQPTQTQPRPQPQPQPSTLSSYMPLIVIGGLGIVGTVAYFAFFRKPAEEKAEAPKKANPKKSKKNRCR